MSRVRGVFSAKVADNFGFQIKWDSLEIAKEQLFVCFDNVIFCILFGA